MAARTKAARKTAGKAGKAAAQARHEPVRAAVHRGPRAARQRARRVRLRPQGLQADAERQGPGEGARRGQKLQKELRDDGRLAASRRASSSAASGGSATPVRKLLMLAILGGIAALILSEGARKAVLDRIFGAEEEFEYTSSTAPHAAVPS